MVKQKLGPSWLEELPCSVMVCDKKYKVVYMNQRAAEAHKEDGGMALLGTNLMECHPPKAQKKLREVMTSGRPNVYSIEKNGVKRQIFQSQWKVKGHVSGLVELNFEIPWDMPHHKRD